VELTHGTEKIVAQVWGVNDTIKNKIGKELIVEMNYGQLLAIKLIKDFNDSDASISQKDNAYILKGRVHQIIKTEDDFLIDLYLQTGPEFLLISESIIGDLELKEGQGIELEVSDLKFFPKN
tara:strand:- start:1122 stop:1487 length:366 start_codon:yes stop_codon:yes gene_type:complete